MYQNGDRLSPCGQLWIVEQEASSCGMKETNAIPVPRGPTVFREFLALDLSAMAWPCPINIHLFSAYTYVSLSSYLGVLVHMLIQIFMESQT